MEVYIIKSRVPTKIQDSEEFMGLLNSSFIKTKIKYSGNLIEKGAYISDNFEIDNENEVVFIFGDYYIISKMKEFCESVNNTFSEALIECINITKEVKFNTYRNKYFNQIFYSENSEIEDMLSLKKYLIKYTSKDEILDKIRTFGMQNLTELDKLILNDKAQINLKYSLS